IGMLLIMLFIQSRVLRGRSFTTVSGKAVKREPIDLGRMKWLATAAIVLYVLLAVVLPLIQLVLGSFQSFFGLYTNFTLRNYEAILAEPTVLEAIQLTGLLAVFAGFAAVSLATGFVFVLRHSP